MAEKVDPDDLLDAAMVAAELGLASAAVVSVYRSRYKDFPKPLIERGRCRLWLRADVVAWRRPADKEQTL
jgi:hypothetical protein